MLNHLNDYVKSVLKGTTNYFRFDVKLEPKRIIKHKQIGISFLMIKCKYDILEISNKKKINSKTISY